MVESLIWYVSVCGSAALFLLIGFYAERRAKPMWFWAGTEIKESEITDTAQFNKENGRMWKLYSVWFWLAGFAEILSSTVALILLAAACTLGLFLLVRTFRKIERKYRIR